MKLKLRKCEEHDDCQLQQVDDGEWKHTPNDTPIRERFGAELTPQQEAMLQRLTEDIRRASNTREWAEEAAVRINMLEQMSIQTEARLRALETRLTDLVSTTEEALMRLDERAEEVERIVSASSKLVGDSERLADFVQRAQSLEDFIKKESYDLNARVDKAENATKHEREERLQATKKEQKQIQMLSERIG